MYLLDTNICIYIANKRPINVLRKFEQIKPGELFISVITYGELYYGVQKSAKQTDNLSRLDNFINLIKVSPLPMEVGQHYGILRAELEKQGKSIGGNDLWIAAHALALGITLVTNNEKKFSRLANLKIENWVNDSL